MALSSSAMSLAKPSPNAANTSAGILAALMFLLPTLGAVTPLLVQDTLKSALLACGVLIAALLFVGRVGRRGPQKYLLHWHTMLWLPLALFVYALISMLWSHAYMAGTDAARWFILGLLIWLGLNTFTRANRHWLVLGIHAGAVFAALWAAAQFWGNLSLFPQGPAPASTFYNRNFFAEYAVCALPFSVWWISTLRQMRWLVVTALCIALEITAILMTGTRSALLALLVVLPLLCLLLWHLRADLPWPRGARRKQLLLALLLAMAVLGNLPNNNPKIQEETPNATPWQRSLSRAQTLTHAGGFNSGSFSMRTDMWLSTVRMVLDHPLRGVGAGSWEIQIPLYQRDDTALEIDYYAHNEYLQLLSEYGLPTGGLALALLMAYWIRSTITTVRLAASAKEEMPARAFSLLSLLALAIVSCAGFPWHLAGTTALMGLCIALLCASDIHLEPPTTQPLHTLNPRSRLHWCVVLALSTTLATTLYICQRAFRAEQKILTALLLSDQLPSKAVPLTVAQQATKALLLEALHEGVALHPHYRKLTAQVAEVMMQEEDWSNAAWILQSVADSHPHISAIWSGLALAYAHMHQSAQAQNALQHLQSLRPLAKSTQNLEIGLLSTSGQDNKAKELIQGYFAHREIDYEMTMNGYALGIKLQDQALAVQALELRKQYWPQSTADSYFRMGQVYRDIAPRDNEKALQAFARGLQSVPPQERSQYIQQVPAPLRAPLASR